MIQRIKQINCAAMPQYNFLFLAPESSLPFALHTNKKAIEYITKNIPKNAQLLVGSLTREGAFNKQTIYNVYLGLIRNCYDKQHLIFGMETNQTAFGENKRIEQPFLKGRAMFMLGKKNVVFKRK